MKNSALKRIIAVLLCLAVFAVSELSGVTNVVRDLYAEEMDDGSETSEDADSNDKTDNSDGPTEAVEEVALEPSSAEDTAQPADQPQGNPGTETTESETTTGGEAGTEPGSEAVNPDGTEAAEGEAQDGEQKEDGAPAEAGSETEAGTEGTETPAGTEEGSPEQKTGEEMLAVADGTESISAADKNMAASTQKEDVKEERPKFDEEYTVEDQKVTIHVTAEEGVLPAGVKLSVKPVIQQDVEALEADDTVSEEEVAEAKELNAKFEDVQKELEATVAEDETKKIAGFLAYDISFLLTDEDGKTTEIEPEGGVAVTIEFEKAYLPEEVASDETIQIDSVDVVHMKETEDGLKPEVLGDAEVNTTETAEVEKTEFTVDSFSTFVITWTGTEQGTKEFSCDAGDVIIKVTAENENVIPAGTSLQVLPILSTNENTAVQYQDVEKKLQEKAETESYEIAGFFAYDISFIDKEGNEVEPNGKVTVAMEYKKAAIPEDLKDLSAQTFELKDGEEASEAEEQTEEIESNITVMHLEENEAGEVTVVDMGANGAVTELVATDNKEIRRAEFVAESFSVFVITWTSGISVKINVHYVNANWYEIDTPQLKEIKDYTGEINLEDYVIPIEGRTFKKIVLDDNTEISKLRGKYNTSTDWWGNETYIFYGIQHNSGGKWSDGTWGASGSSWKDWITSSTTTDKDIYIVYSGDEAGPIEGDFGEPDHKKYIKYNEETDDYTLTLDVTGKRGEATGVDVLLVIDKSGSMGSGSGSGYYNLLPTLKTTVKDTIVPKILPDATSINKVAAVSFSSNGYTGSDISTKWEGYAGKGNITSNSSGTGKLSANGGTNWQLAMQKAETKLAEVSSDNNQKVVIFMSDGDPGYYYGTNGNETGSSNGYNQKAFNKAVDEVTGSTYLKDAKIYSVYLTSGTQTRMSSFATQLRSKGIDAEAVDGTNMTTALDNLVAEIVAPAYKNVVIEDTLSEYVEFVSTDVAAFTVICKKNGVETTLTNGEDYTLAVDDQTKKVILSLLKGTDDTEGDELDAEATYSISFKIKPSAKARSEYSEKGYAAYTGTGGDGTDAPNNTTSSGRKGFYSNAEAVVRYQVNDKVKDPAQYKKPVVQINPFENGDEPLLGEPAHSKKIKKVDDNHYRLSLDVKGEIGNSSEIDVLFIIDESGSMNNSVNGTQRSKIVTDAIKTFKTTLQATDAVKNGDLIVNAAAVTFSGPTSSGSETDVQSCRNGSAGDASGGTWQNLSSFGVTLSPSGGTNWQAGVRKGAEVLQGRSGNKKYVIFVTDGNPTFRYATQNGNLKTQGNGSSDSHNLSYNAAVLEWTKSSVLASSNTGKYVIDTDNVTKAQDFATAIGASYLKGTDKKSLEKQFEDIAKDILRPAYTNVYIQDTLSDYVEFASNNLSGINLKGYRIDEKGAETELPNTSYTVEFNPDSKVIKVNLLGGNRLEDGVTYRFEYDVVVTEEAYKEYLTNGYGNIVGDPGTDAEGNTTSDNTPGLRSNSEAIVGYTVNEKSGTNEYLHPVVQTASVNHTVVKEWEGGKGEPITVQLKASVQKGDGSKLDLIKENYTPLPENMSQQLSEGEGGTWSYTWNKLPKYYREVVGGKAVFTEITYTVEEILTSEQQNKYKASVSESEDGLTTTIVNSPAIEWRMIKVSENSDSLTLPGATFTLTEQIKDNGKITQGKVYTGTSDSDGVIQWKDGDREISSGDIKAGDYKLAETKAPDGYRRSETEWNITIGYNGPELDGSADENICLKTDKDLVTVLIKNKTLYTLPETGGIGTYRYTISGALLMMAGMLILYRNKKKYAGRC